LRLGVTVAGAELERVVCVPEAARPRLASAAEEVRRVLDAALPEGGELRLALLGGLLRDLLTEANRGAKADG
jgi:hypothetical protein